MFPTRLRRPCRPLFSAPLLALSLPLLALGTSRMACADDANVGGDARAFAMGGAGLALPYAGGQRINPASLAYEKTPVGIAIPSIGLRTDGLSQSDIKDIAKDGNSHSAGDLLRQFVSADRTIGVNSDFSARLGKLEIATFGAVSGHVQPNAIFSHYLQTGNTDPNQLPFGSQADLIAGGYYTLPAVSMASTLPASTDWSYNVGLGLRIKKLKGVYTHYIANTSVLNSTTSDALHAPEMNGADVLSKSGTGVDASFYAQPHGGQGLGYAVMINNLINPNLSFAGTDKNGAATTYKLLNRTYNAGLGYQNKATSLAADLIDITGATEKIEVRLGAEQNILKVLSVRAGFASHTGYTYGIGFYSLGIAGGKHLPLELSQTLKF